jgi:hypothetical protein
MDGDAMYRSYSSPTWEDVRLFEEELDKLRKADAETQREFLIRAGIYDKDGNIAEEYRGLFEGKQ